MLVRIPIGGPWINEKEIRSVSEAVAHGWYANSAKYQGEFERAFAAFTGRRHGVALPSCTAGLHLALLAPCGEGWGGGGWKCAIMLRAPSLSLPRKRGRGRCGTGHRR
jgi:hypothetical protein